MTPQSRAPTDAPQPFDTRLDSFLRVTCSAVVVLLACWTVLANIIALSGNSFGDLLRLAPLVLIASVVIIAYLGIPRMELASALAGRKPGAGGKPEDSRRLIHLLLGAALAAIFAFGNQYRIFWVLTVLYLAFFFLRQLRAPLLQIRRAGSGPWNNLPFFAALAFALLGALLINRVNVDQTLAINMTVSVLDNPGAGIFTSDSVHGIPGVYLIPSYRVHSFELLTAMIAKVLNIADPITVLHFIFAPLLSLFCVLAAARFFRVFLPRWWGWATLALIAILLVLRSTYTMYGNFAFVRMFEGKSLFLTALIPLIVVYAAEFFAQPNLKNWLLLFFAQAAAVGMTANALYAAPIAAGLGLAACWRPSWSASRRLAIGLLASIYPVVVG